ncbi:hypothetical protein ILYODFUR_012317 [Ilyodon furcidens]|uniref:Uncharacterized protein n=1 Tax=Ilyodon furcidens TaxID=33524 RepID=A0ABV0TVS3_9TELE
MPDQWLKLPSLKGLERPVTNTQPLVTFRLHELFHRVTCGTFTENCTHLCNSTHNRKSTRTFTTIIFNTNKMLSAILKFDMVFNCLQDNNSEDCGIYLYPPVESINQHSRNNKISLIFLPNWN